MDARGKDRFELLGTLGKGASGIVYEAYDRQRELPVALKSLRHVDAEQIFRFKHEFRVLANLSHPNIVTFYDLVHDEDQQRWFLTMELVRGVDFMEHVRPPGARELIDHPTTAGSTPAGSASVDRSTATRTYSAAAIPNADLLETASSLLGAMEPSITRHPAEAVVDLDRLRAALVQLSAALRSLHAAGIVHRDLKPSNVRVTPEGRVVLMDFGIATQMRTEHDLHAGQYVKGTPQYMAPEQLLGDAPTGATDWFAFGVLMYLSLTGALPHAGDRSSLFRAQHREPPIPPSVRTEGLPEDLERLTMKLLAWDARARPSGRTVAMVLRHGAVTTTSRLPSGPTEEAELFVGRSSELATLGDAYERAETGGTACVLVKGPSGMGKSSLVRRFLAGLDVRTRPSVILSGRSHERENLAYRAFDGIIDDLCRYLLDLAPQALDEVLDDDIELLARLFPVLRALPACEVAGDPWEWRGPDTVRKEAMDALRRLLGKLCEYGPVVLHTEDLQWADAGSFRVLHALMDDPQLPGVLLVATVRSEDLAASSGSELQAAVERLDQTGRCQHVTVGPLTSGEQEQLRQAFAERHGSAALVHDDAWRSCAGHPLMLAEVTRYRMAPGRSSADRLGAALRLEDVIVARYARMSEPSQRLLDAVVVAGEPTALPCLAAAAGLTHAQREQALVELRVASLVRVLTTRAEPWLDSYHDRVRTAITGHLGKGAAPVHRALAQELEQSDPRPAATIAKHRLACGEVLEAARCLVQAAEHADATLAFEQADQLRRELLAVLSGQPGSPAVARMGCEARIGLARRMRVTDRHQDALGCLAPARALATAHELPALSATIFNLMGGSMFSTGDIAGCRAAHQAACAQAQRAGSPEAEARAFSGLGDAAYARGHMLSAHEEFSRCVALSTKHGFPEIELSVSPMLAWVDFYRNEPGLACARTLEAVTRADMLHNLRVAVIARGALGRMALEHGLFEEAERELTQGVEQSRALGAPKFEAINVASLGHVLALRGEVERGLALLDQSLALIRRSGLSLFGPWILGLLAYVAPDLDRRRAALDEAEQALSRGAVSHNYLLFYRDAMDIAAQLGEPERVERYADALETYTQEQPLPFAEFFVTRGRAMAAHLRGAAPSVALEQLCEDAEANGFRWAKQQLRALLDGGSVANARP